MTKVKARVLQDTDIANAKRFAAQHGEDVCYTPERGWRYYDGTRWDYDMKDVIASRKAIKTAESVFDEIRESHEKDSLFKWAKQSQSRSCIKSMLDLARSLPSIAAHETDFDSNPMALNCLNGTLDMLSGELKTHNPLDKITQIANTNYDPDAKCPLWVSFLDTVMQGNQEMIGYLQRVAGYTLTGNTGEQVMFFLYGIGKNGKTVFIEIMRDLMGDYGCVSPTSMILRRSSSGIRNDVARLVGKRFVCMNETAQGESMDEQLVKDMTGGDTLAARFMRQEFFEFQPMLKLWIRGNHKLTISGTDDGIWRRMHMIQFTYHVPEQDRDKDLRQKIEKSELSGVLNWCLEGCHQWQRHGLQPPEAVIEAVNQYRSDSDLLGQFIEEKCETGQHAKVGCQAMLTKFKSWAGNETDLNRSTFASAMEERNFKKSNKIGGKYYYLGVQIAASELAHHTDVYNH